MENVPYNISWAYSNLVFLYSHRQVNLYTLMTITCISPYLTQRRKNYPLGVLIALATAICRRHSWKCQVYLGWTYPTKKPKKAVNTGEVSTVRGVAGIASGVRAPR